MPKQNPHLHRLQKRKMMNNQGPHWSVAGWQTTLGEEVENTRWCTILGERDGFAVGAQCLMDPWTYLPREPEAYCWFKWRVDLREWRNWSLRYSKDGRKSSMLEPRYGLTRNAENWRNWLWDQNPQGSWLLLFPGSFFESSNNFLFLIASLANRFFLLAWQLEEEGRLILDFVTEVTSKLQFRPKHTTKVEIESYFGIISFSEQLALQKTEKLLSQTKLQRSELRE